MFFLADLATSRRAFVLRMLDAPLVAHRHATRAGSCLLVLRQRSVEGEKQRRYGDQARWVLSMVYICSSPKKSARRPRCRFVVERPVERHHGVRRRGRRRFDRPPHRGRPMLRRRQCRPICDRCTPVSAMIASVIEGHCRQAVDVERRGFGREERQGRNEYCGCDNSDQASAQCR